MRNANAASSSAANLNGAGCGGNLWNLVAVFAVFLLVLVVVSAFYMLLLAFEF